MSANRLEANENIIDEQNKKKKKNSSEVLLTLAKDLKTSASLKADRDVVNKESIVPFKNFANFREEITVSSLDSVEACEDNGVQISGKKANTVVGIAKNVLMEIIENVASPSIQEDKDLATGIDSVSKSNVNLVCNKIGKNVGLSSEINDVENIGIEDFDNKNNINNVISEESLETSINAELMMYNNSDLDANEVRDLKNPTLYDPEFYGNNDSEQLITEEKNLKGEKHIESISNMYENLAIVKMEETLDESDTFMDIGKSKFNVLDEDNESENYLNIKKESFDDTEDSRTHNTSHSYSILSCISRVKKEFENIQIESDTLSCSNAEDLEMRWDNYDDEVEDSEIESNETSKSSNNFQAKRLGNHFNFCLLEINNNKMNEHGLLNDTVNTTLTSNTSYLSFIEHGLKRPDLLLEFPTQEFSEFSVEGIDVPSGLEGNLDKETEKKIAVDVLLKTDTIPNNVLVLSSDLHPHWTDKNSKSFESSSSCDNKLLGIEQDSNKKATDECDEINKEKNKIIESGLSRTVAKNMIENLLIKCQEPQPSTSQQNNKHNALENIP